MPTIVDGVASSVAIDTAGEIVDLKGLDISSLVGAPANWEHESKLPSQIIGKIIEAHKIFSEEDCQNERHKYFWNKTKIPFLYCKVRLFDNEENKKPSAVEVASLFKDDAAHPEEQPIVGFSIEGSKLNKEGVTVTHSIARKLTITCIPANKTCIAELVPSKEEEKMDFIFGEAKEFLKNEENLEKKETKIPTSINETNENIKENKQKAGKKIPTSKNETNEGLEKALAAGSMMAAPSALVGGSALGKESIDKKIKKSSDKPFHGYNPEKHSKEGGLKDSYREKYNKEHGSHLKRPVTGKVKPGSKAAKRRKSFCARMSGVPGPTSKEGKLTPKGAALKRWKCSKSEELSLEKKDRCWEGYEPTPGKKPYEKGSCKPMKKSDWSKKADDAYQNWMDKDNFKKYMKKRMPHLADGEVDAIGRILALKKEMQKEESMSKMYSSYFSKNENDLKNLEKGLKENLVGAAMLLSSANPAHAVSGHLHKYISSLKNVPGVQVESNFKPLSEKSNNGTGSYSIKIGPYTIKGKHFSLGTENNNHEMNFYGPKEENQDLQSKTNASYIFNHLKEQAPKIMGIPSDVKINKSEELDKGARGDWEKEGYKIHYEELPKSMYGSTHNDIQMVATHPEHGEVGWAYLVHDPEDPNNLHTQNVHVKEPHRRKGLGSAMYSLAEKKTNKKLIPSPYTTRSKDAEAFWSQPNRPFGKSEKPEGIHLDKEEGMSKMYSSYFSKNENEKYDIEKLEKAINDQKTEISKPAETTDVIDQGEKTAKGFVDPKDHYVKLAIKHGIPKHWQVDSYDELKDFHPNKSAKKVFNNSGQHHLIENQDYVHRLHPLLVGDTLTTNKKNPLFINTKENLDSLLSSENSHPLNVKYFYDLHPRTQGEIGKRAREAKISLAKNPNEKLVTSHMLHNLLSDDVGSRKNDLEHKFELARAISNNKNAKPETLTNIAQNSFRAIGKKHGGTVPHEILKNIVNNSSTPENLKNIINQEMQNNPNAPGLHLLASGSKDPDELKYNYKWTKPQNLDEVGNPVPPPLPQKLKKPETSLEPVFAPGESKIGKNENLEKTTDIMMAAEKKDGEVYLPEKEFKEEHEHLIDVLSNPTTKKLKEEKKKQEKEVKKNEVFEKLQKSPEVNEGYSNVHIPDHPTKSGNYVKTKVHKPTGNRIHIVHAKEGGVHRGSIYYTTENGRHDGKVTSQIHIDHFDPEAGSMDAARVSHALTGEEHRGKGLNPLLHISALKDFGKIQSDTTLSPASQRMYEKLSKHPNIDVEFGQTNDPNSSHILKWKSKIKKSEKIIFDKNIIKNIANK